MLPSIRRVSCRLRLRVQQVPFYFYTKKLPGYSIYTCHRNLSDVWGSTTRSTRDTFFLSQRYRWNHCFYMWTEVLSKGFHAGVRAIGYSHGLIPANESVQHSIKCQPLGTFVVCFYASLWLQLFTRICTDLDWTTDLKYATRLGQTSSVLRAPVRKNRTYLGMGGQFDFIFLWKNARL